MVIDDGLLAIPSQLTWITRAEETAVLWSSYYREDDAFMEELTSKRSRATVIICCECRLFGDASLSGGRCTLCSHQTCTTCRVEVHLSPRIVKPHSRQHRVERQSNAVNEIDSGSAGKSFFEAKSIIAAELAALKRSSHGSESRSHSFLSTTYLAP